MNVGTREETIDEIGRNETLIENELTKENELTIIGEIDKEKRLHCVVTKVKNNEVFKRIVIIERTSKNV